VQGPPPDFEYAVEALPPGRVGACARIGQALDRFAPGTVVRVDCGALTCVLVPRPAAALAG
jgi:hypothetical protein